ncbi:hypothetical protein FA15DRAFT_760066 [Coprinopsis marcescibilis]|uniref:Uncharacterized protein n=1 Tax=Coprinopsis marcescibilis TaxID=230819 RepID=A0A5C3KHY3_COPMA|nr:hypothetical protein FA15DRAFT_760066 [Coprinopsis marcescibilis]
MSSPSTPNSSHGEPLPDSSSESSRSKVPIWLPVSAFVGTSLALAIPMMMVRRQRNLASKIGLRSSGFNATSPPPRRILGSTAPSTDVTTARLKALATTPVHSGEVKMGAASDHEKAGLGSLMSAMSKLTLSNAMFAGKAFAIATCLVAVGGTAFAWTVKSLMGVNDAREFGVRARALLWSAWPGLTSSIHRSPNSEAERQGAHQKWNWEEAEKRLSKAYDQGGIPLWAQAALREVEAEARVERTKREREVQQSLDRTSSPS